MEKVDYNELVALLDERYVRKNDCTTKHELLSDELKETQMQAADTKIKLSLIIKIGSAAAVASIGAFVSALWTLITK